MITITRKRGDTRRLRFHTEFALADVAITASARDSGGTARAIPAGVVDLDARLFELWGIGDLPVGLHACEVEYARLGHTIPSQTFFLQITEAMTP
ncbi:hypothetical protein ROE7235_03752 [Roseibaca ekhonensis]|jgi:hypothetical protein|uniref:Uncharacterized protein n=1 Tax=Roseinatronobacter ekhonensis TaxID=254356 RepID=A0A3B0MDN4_9RHOB|nr:hypothetical protein [Roseibaca ekhonensis]SUZ33971.1 hypothetical protein ROE7235_03752 [Roseibaca ekhonensis]